MSYSFWKGLPKFESSSFDTFTRTLKSFKSTVEQLRKSFPVIEEIAKNSCYIFFLQNFTENVSQKTFA